MFEKLRKLEDNSISKKYFLEDKPLEKLNDDKFQYNQVADILYDLLKQNHFPIHIGLFGPWGSGKTSVIKFLEKIINADKENGRKFLVKIISVWKFADDAPSLHRKIVREVQALLDVIDEEGLNKESSLTNTITGTGIYSLLIKNKRFKYSAIIFALIVIGSIVYSILFKNPAITAIINSIISVGTIGIVFGALKLFPGTFQNSSQSTVKLLPLSHGDQYEARFQASVENFLKKNKGKSLILVFDDLDRLPPKQLLAALNTIKTFLHSKYCAFIIPCDESVLRNDIKAAFKEKDIDGPNDNEKYVSEFINKTFDYQLHLPILEQKNMKRYAKQLLLDQQIYWLEDSEIYADKVLGILIHSSIQTPRQAKTLLNAFSENWQLAKKRDHESGRNLLSADPLAIAVFTVLQTDFPEYYQKLISDPYLISNPENFKNENNPELSAYLTRVEKCIPKDDPRPFIYFSNEKLNPATGKPEVIKTKNFLINAQVDLFKSSFENLDKKDREILFSSVISDFDDNPGIEVDNCLKTLIEAEPDLSVVSGMDLHNWDLLIRNNLDNITEFPPSKVCRLLNCLSYDNRTWSEYGSKIKVFMYSDDILRLWIENPSFIEKLSIPSISTELENAYIVNSDGYTLANTLFEVQQGHRLLKSIDWLDILQVSLDTNVDPPYSLTSWLNMYSLKTKNKVTTALINELLKRYEFKTEKFLEGIGQLWCDSFDKNDADLTELIKLMDHDSFYGFTVQDFDKINNFMETANYSEVHDVLRPLLDQWWSDEKYEKVTTYLKTFTKSPGITGFCEENFDFDLDDETQELFLTIIVDRAGNLANGIPHVVETLQSEVGRSTNNGTKSQTPNVVKILIQSSKLRDYITSKRETLVPISDKNIWLSWVPQVVNDRLEIFFDLWGKDETATQWIFDCVDTFAFTRQNLLNPGRQYQNFAYQYMNLFVQRLCEFYTEIDWNKIVKKWRSLAFPNNTNDVLDIFSLLDSTSRCNLLSQLSRRCNLGNNEFNTLLIQYYDPSVSALRQALFTRWEVIGPENRKNRIEYISNNIDNEEVKESIKLLETHFNNNPLETYLEEMVEWNVEDSIRQKFITILIDKLSIDIVTQWVHNSMDFMNKDGFHKWKGFSIEIAISKKKVNVRNLESTLEVALSLGKDRAKIALQFLLVSGLNKIEMKKFREKIIDLQNDYPEYVKQFGFRFKLKKDSAS